MIFITTYETFAIQKNHDMYFPAFLFLPFFTTVFTFKFTVTLNIHLHATKNVFPCDSLALAGAIER